MTVNAKFLNIAFFVGGVALIPVSTAFAMTLLLTSALIYVFFIHVKPNKKCKNIDTSSNNKRISIFFESKFDRLSKYSCTNYYIYSDSFEPIYKKVIKHKGQDEVIAYYEALLDAVNHAQELYIENSNIDFSGLTLYISQASAYESIRQYKVEKRAYRFKSLRAIKGTYAILYDLPLNVQFKLVADESEQVIDISQNLKKLAKEELDKFIEEKWDEYKSPNNMPFKVYKPRKKFFKKSLSVVIDGSFREREGIAITSGAMIIDGQSDFFHELYNGEIQSSNHSEHKAINNGLIEALKLKSSDEKRELDVYTDSKTTIDLLFQKRIPKDFEESTLQETYDLISQWGGTVNFFKVQSHVPKCRANEIERVHNVVDELAHTVYREYT